MRPRRVDPHFEPEAEAARRAGHQVAAVDHDALTSPGGAAAALSAVPASGSQRCAVYRGWMLHSEEYRDFASALADRGVALRTSPDQYRTAHELPGWYPALCGLTPPSVWTSGPARADFDRCRRELGSGPVMLRDYTQSMKHYWDEAAFIPEDRRPRTPPGESPPGSWSYAKTPSPADLCCADTRTSTPLRVRHLVGFRSLPS